MKKIKSDSRPLYRQAEQALTELLQTYSPGDQLPPEPALAQSLGISRATLREAMRNLAEKGVVTRRQGRGTFFNGPRLRIDSGLEALVSVDALAQSQGLQCSTTDLEITAEAADPDVAAALRLAPGDAVTAVRRIKVAEGRPVAYMVDVLPRSIATVEEVRAGFAGSVLDFLLARGRPVPSHAAANIVPLKAGRELAGRLGVSAGTVLLLLEEVVSTRDNIPINYSRNFFVPQYFQFHLLRRIPG